MALCHAIDPATSLYCSLPADHEEDQHAAINFFEHRVLARWPRVTAQNEGADHNGSPGAGVRSKKSVTR